MVSPLSYATVSICAVMKASTAWASALRPKPAASAVSRSGKSRLAACLEIFDSIAVLGFAAKIHGAHIAIDLAYRARPSTLFPFQAPAPLGCPMLPEWRVRSRRYPAAIG